MQEELSNESQKRELTKAQKAAIAKSVRNLNVSQIMDEKLEAELQPDDLDPSNPHQLIRTEIYYYFIAHDVEDTQREHLLSLGEIANRTIPVSFHLSETVAKEIVSIVGRSMLRKALMVEAFRESGGNPLDDEKLAEIDDQVVTFNLQRNQLFRQKQVQDNPEKYENLARAGQEATGTRLLTDEEIKRLNELKQSELWEEGTIHAGKTNWRKVAEAMTKEFDREYTPKRLLDVLEKRRRSARKKGR